MFEDMFSNIFGILSMADNYDARVVVNTRRDKFVLDTCVVTDRDFPYETAVKHRDFNGGDWIVLEWSSTKKDAQKVHAKWLEKLDTGVDSLSDVYTGERFE